jgi:hypothetical protein
MHHDNQIKNEKQNQTFADSLWSKYAKAMESKNIDYLIQNSLDTIECCECELNKENTNEYYGADYVFRNHLDKLMHFRSLSDRDFSTYQLDDIIRVHYGVKGKLLGREEEAYDLIFTFIKTINGWKFQGMLLT